MDFCTGIATRVQMARAEVKVWVARGRWLRFTAVIRFRHPRGYPAEDFFEDHVLDLLPGRVISAMGVAAAPAIAASTARPL